MTSLPPWILSFVAVAVTGVWVVANLVDPLLPGYTVHPELHIVMGIVAGAATGGRIVSGRHEDREAARPQEPDGETDEERRERLEQTEEARRMLRRALEGRRD